MSSISKQKKAILNRNKLRTDMFDEQGQSGENFAYDYEIEVSRKKVGKKQFSIINAPNLDFYGSKCARYVEFLLKNELLEHFKVDKYTNILYFGLGNDEITADAFGEKVVKRLFISKGIDFIYQTSAICPSVQAKTGLKTADVVKAIVQEFEPDLVVFFDTLASRSITRLGCSFQLNNDGIAVGSGVGNFNKFMNKKFLDCDCLVVGVPFMIYAENFVKEINANIKNKNLLKELVMTPKNIDRQVVVCAQIVGNAFNNLLFPELSQEEIENIMSI